KLLVSWQSLPLPPVLTVRRPRQRSPQLGAPPVPQPTPAVDHTGLPPSDTQLRHSCLRNSRSAQVPGEMRQGRRPPPPPSARSRTRSPALPAAARSQQTWFTTQIDVCFNHTSSPT